MPIIPTLTPRWNVRAASPLAVHVHRWRDLVDDRRAHPETVLVAVDDQPPAVDGKRGALLLAGSDQPDDPLLRGPGYDRPHLARDVASGADLHRLGLGRERV